MGGVVEEQGQKQGDAWVLLSHPEKRLWTKF